MPTKENQGFVDTSEEDLEDNELDESSEESDGKEAEDKNPPTEQAIGDQEDGSVILEVEEETDESDGGDGKTDPPEDDEDAEIQAKREARRVERQERKQRQREKEERYQRELAQEREARRQLESRLATIERRNNGSEIAQIDGTIRQVDEAYNFFKSKVAEGTKAGDGEMVAEATEKMVLARERGQQLRNLKAKVEKDQNTPAPLDERLVNNANTFMKRHSWFRTDGRDIDSVMMRTLDNAVAAEGWDPTTKEYWDELESRVKKYLPHRVKGAKVQHNDQAEDERTTTAPRTKPKSVVSGSSSTVAPVATAAKATFHLSAERKKAIMEAGMWDDPKKRSAMIKTYMEYDKANKKGAR